MYFARVASSRALASRKSSTRTITHALAHSYARAEVRRTRCKPSNALLTVQLASNGVKGRRGGAAV